MECIAPHPQNNSTINKWALKSHVINVRQSEIKQWHKSRLTPNTAKHADSDSTGVYSTKLSSVILKKEKNVDIFPPTKSVQMRQTAWCHHGLHIFVSIKAGQTLEEVQKSTQAFEQGLFKGVQFNA